MNVIYNSRVTYLNVCVDFGRFSKKRGVTDESSGIGRGNNLSQGSDRRTWASLLIDYNGKRYLLDSGQTGEFLNNAHKMGVDLSTVQTAILSHGHYDHAGGFAGFFAQYPSQHLYVTDCCDEPHFFHTAKVTNDIGIQPEVLRYSSRFNRIHSFAKIDDGVWLLPHSTPGTEKIGERTKLYRGVDGKMVPDDFAHEMSLIFRLDDGLAVFNSCSHVGICIILDEVHRQFPDQEVTAFFGGLHMKGTKHHEEICLYTHEEVVQTADEVRKAGIRLLATGHCTGDIAFSWLKSELGDIVQRLSTGAVFELH